MHDKKYKQNQNFKTIDRRMSTMGLRQLDYYIEDRNQVNTQPSIHGQLYFIPKPALIEHLRRDKKYVIQTKKNHGTEFVHIENPDIVFTFINILVYIQLSELEAGDVKSKIIKFFKNSLGIDDLGACIKYLYPEPHGIGNHIKQGITFYPDFILMKTKILDSNKFHKDNRSSIFGKLAALATEGDGYRSDSWPSAHVALSQKKCNIHIDEIPFLSKGGAYNYNCFAHIIDELVLADKLKLSGKYHKTQWIRPQYGIGNVGLELCGTATNSDLSRGIDVCGGVSFANFSVGRDSKPKLEKELGVGVRVGFWF